MKKYKVFVKEIHVSTMIVEAASEAHALELVTDGGGEQETIEYSETLDNSEWTTKEVL